VACWMRLGKGYLEKCTQCRLSGWFGMNRSIWALTYMFPYRLQGDYFARRPGICRKDLIFVICSLGEPCCARCCILPRGPTRNYHIVI
jgi:hypothetical protein